MTMISVIKLGGSLLDLPDLDARWNQFLEVEQLHGIVLLIVGGGNIVEAIRFYDSIHSLDSVQSHWLCVDLMNSTAALLSLLLKDVAVIHQANQLDSWLQDHGNLDGQHGSRCHSAIIAPSAFYSRELRSDQLPQSWDTTSDSISALLARIVGAKQLILLKSTDEELSKEPLLDRTFGSSFADKISWRTVNLRAAKYD